MKKNSLKKRVLAATLATLLTTACLPAVSVFGASSPPRIGQITVNPENRFQTMEGWGTSLCWWGNTIGSAGNKDYNNNGRADREEIAELAFSPEYLNLNIVRYNLGGGDKADSSIRRVEGLVPGWSTDMFGSPDGTGDFLEDEFYNKPSDEMGDAGQIWMLEQANAYRKTQGDIINEVFSNSPPYYMTKSGSSTGGYSWNKENLKNDYYDDFSLYLARATNWLDKRLQANYGTGIDYVEPLNEPDTSYWINGSSKQEGCTFWPGGSQNKIINETQKALAAQGLTDVAITGTDETDLDRAIYSFEHLDTEAQKNIATISAHTYGGNNAERNELRQLAASFDKKLWMSEVTRGGDGHSEAAHNSMEKTNAEAQSNGIINDLKYMQPTAWVAWLVADSEYECIQTNSNWGLIHYVFEEDGPVKGYHTKLFNGDGSVKADVPASGYWAVTKQFYTMMQYSKYLKAGYTLIEIGDEDMVAALSPDNKELVVVAQNFGSARSTSLDLYSFEAAADAKVYRTSDTENCELVEEKEVLGGVLDITLPENSVSTFVVTAKDGSTLLQAEGYSQRVDCNIELTSNAQKAGASANNKFTYSSGWYSGNDNTERWTTSSSASTTFTFTGTQGLIYGKKSSNGAKLLVSVDGGEAVTVNTAQSSSKRNLLLFDTGTLPQGKHTVEISMAEGQTVSKPEIVVEFAKVVQGQLKGEEIRIRYLNTHDGIVRLGFESVSGANSYTVAYGTAMNQLTESVSAANGQATITGLTNGTTYYVQVQADNLCTSKIAEVEVGAPQGPLYYYVNAGTETPYELATGESFGSQNSLLDQAFAADPVTGKSWGYAGGKSAPHVEGPTKWDSLRVDEQDTPGKGLQYKFEAAPGNYLVRIGMNDPWSNSGRRQDIRIQGEVRDKELVPGNKTVKQYSAQVEEGQQLVVEILRSQNNSGKNEDPLVNFIEVELVATISLAELADELARIKEEMGDKRYTPVSLAAFEKTRQAAQALVDASSEDAQKIAAAFAKLQEGFSGLKPVALNSSISGVDGAALYDTNGVKIQAHGGQIQQFTVDGVTKYYWIGEDKTYGYRPVGGIHVYSSTDLYNWDDEGVVLRTMSNINEFETDPYFKDLYGDYTQEKKESTFIDLDKNHCVIERPKMLYNEKTGKYVIWFHADGHTPENPTSDYGKAKAGVAIADSPAGPFKLLGSYRLNYNTDADLGFDSPSGFGTVRDMNLFLEDDGTAYVIYSSEGNRTLFVSRLNEEFTGLATPRDSAVEGVDFTRNFIGWSREAPAMFKYLNKYYLVSSGCTGWSPNPAKYAVADHPMGPWKDMGDPCEGSDASTTFYTQSTCVFPVDAAAGKFVYMGDRWKPDDLEDSRYVWLPVEFPAEENLVLRRYSNWTLDELEGKGEITIATAFAPHYQTIEELKASLPSTLDIVVGGSPVNGSPVSWQNIDTSQKEFGNVTVKGKLTNYDREISLTFTIMDESTIYFFDCTVEESAYHSQLAQALPGLRNAQPDGPYSAESGAGFLTQPGTDHDVHTGSGIFENGWWAKKDKSIEYGFTLQPGEYTLYAGFQEWWDVTRPTKIMVSGTDEQDQTVEIASHNFTLESWNKKSVQDVAFTVPEGLTGPVVVRISKTGGADPVLSWLAITDNTPPAKYTIGVEGGTADKQQAVAGDTVTITAAAPPQGKVFDCWTADPMLDFANDKEPETSFVMPQADVAITALFKDILPAEHPITVAAIENGAVEASLSTAAQGETVFVTVTPSAGYRLVEGSLQGNGVPIEGGSFVMPDEPVELTATFEPAVYSLQVQPSENGTVAIEGDLETACAGQTVQLLVTPAEGYQLTPGSLQVNGLAVADNSFIMPYADAVISAQFEALETPEVSYGVQIAEMTNGSITADKITALGGEVVTLTVTPAAGYRLVPASLKCNGAVLEQPQFTMPNQDVTITAEFERITYRISLMAMTHGTVSVDRKTAAPGEIVTVTVTADKTYQLAEGSLKANDVLIKQNQFTMPEEDVAITAVFEKVNIPPASSSVPAESTPSSQPSSASSRPQPTSNPGGAPAPSQASSRPASTTVRPGASSSSAPQSAGVKTEEKISSSSSSKPASSSSSLPKSSAQSLAENPVPATAPSSSNNAVVVGVILAALLAAGGISLFLVIKKRRGASSK